MTDEQTTFDSEFEDVEIPQDTSKSDEDERRSGGRNGGVLVKLTSKAVSTDPVLAELRATGGETVSYPSRAAAEDALVTNEQVRLQSAGKNADKYDYYLSWKRPDETNPADRGPPEEGWVFQARANEVGALAEALFTSVGRRPAPIVHYACRDLGVEKGALRFWQGTSLDQFQTVADQQDPSWQPDAVFAVYDEAEWQAIESNFREQAYMSGHEEQMPGDALWREREDRALRRVYALEVKHDDASFGRGQRQAMNEILSLNDERVVPLLARVRLDELPQHYHVRIRTGPFDSGV